MQGRQIPVIFTNLQSEYVTNGHVITDFPTLLFWMPPGFDILKILITSKLLRRGHTHFKFCQNLNPRGLFKLNSTWTH